MNTTNEHTTGPGDLTRSRKAALVAKAKQATLSELRALIHTELSTIGGLLHQVRDLVDTHNPGTGLITVEAKTAMASLIRTERRDRIRITTNPDPVGRQWMSPTATGSGPVPAPGSVAAYSVDAESIFTLRAIARDLHRRVTTLGTELGICFLYSRRAYWLRITAATTEPATGQLPVEIVISLIEDLVDVTMNTRLLRSIHRDLAQVTNKLRNLIDGPDVAIPPNPRCPICHRNTLISHLAQHPQTITCDRDHHTGQLHRCVCTDSFCACTHNPHHRHSWANLPRATSRRQRQVDLRWTWDSLHTDQRHIHRALTTPTRRPPVPHDQPTSHHQLRIVWNATAGHRNELVCNAPQVAPCRQTYACAIDGRCDPQGHEPDCDLTLVDLGYCNAQAWIDDDIINLGLGEVTIPIEVSWAESTYVWNTTGQPATTTAP